MRMAALRMMAASSAVATRGSRMLKCLPRRRVHARAQSGTVCDDAPTPSYTIASQVGAPEASERGEERTRLCVRKRMRVLMR
jgi:hypothetical protein